MQLPDVCSAKPPSNCPAGHSGHEVADAALQRPAGHAEQLVPLCAANVPGVHAVQVAALVLPVGLPVPAAQAVPVHAEREPAAAACVPAGQVPPQRHGR
jgi:hypothetical protein